MWPALANRQCSAVQLLMIGSKQLQLPIQVEQMQTDWYALCAAKCIPFPYCKYVACSAVFSVLYADVCKYFSAVYNTECTAVQCTALRSTALLCITALHSIRALHYSKTIHHNRRSGWPSACSPRTVDNNDGPLANMQMFCFIIYVF